LFEKRIAVLTYHKFPKEDWPVEQFTAHRVQLAGGQAVTLKLSERGTQLSNQFWVREIRKLTASGHQTALVDHQLSGLDRGAGCVALCPMVAGKFLSL